MPSSCATDARWRSRCLLPSSATTVSSASGSSRSGGRRRGSSTRASSRSTRPVRPRTFSTSPCVHRRDRSPRALLGSAGRLPAGRTLDILAQVGAALDTVHTHGLVHRDVKPANILVASDADYEHAYLGDFGVAKQIRTESGLTQTGAFIGTVDYAAPEQLEGKTVDARADIYALGCVLYQCLTGLRPFEKGSDAATISAHLFEPPPSAHAKHPDLPPELDDVIARALAESPADRFPSCRELVRAARTRSASGRRRRPKAGWPLTPRRPCRRARPSRLRPRPKSSCRRERGEGAADRADRDRGCSSGGRRRARHRPDTGWIGSGRHDGGDTGCKR